MLMKSVLQALALAAVALAQDSFRLQSWNIRYDSLPDGTSVDSTLGSLDQSIPQDGGPYYADYEEQPWSKRRIGVVNDVIFNRADIFTVNEALKRQVDDIKELLNQLSGQTWDYIGVGRDDGKEKGEYQAIFYNKQKAYRKSDYTIWLSDTPFEPSKHKDAGAYRSTTVARFETVSGTPFTIINTHLDHVSNDQRKLSASLLRQLGAHEHQHGDGPVFLVGDLNSPPEGQDSGAYKIAVGSENTVSINETFAQRFDASNAKNFVFSDLLGETDAAQRSGHHGTFNKFEPISSPDAVGDRIDFQFAGTIKGESSKKYKVERTRVAEVFYDLGYRISDHRPIISDISIQK
ncbi:Glucose-repressible alcohol dehydrogenase transcriptional effector [Wickerhamomyces ciferrii]|uniref:Glucose-repressible alcohol dehydrogenase transcriptional effector n=1 Tax=Wickerhamomyces ciferrii (strain ATCC 14091 / BCRC 22168 / CBS 111 / JCM 3599 / NBRC 0793 / NRRL Y-1031 F-60-10) TaxID=1206466 RepID=K0KST7_WICCF|nr:Glucose-repressible alcohol dehydrogenase transcriptional effector [Wickerhamomyces ciferrii]CCH44434.1 Glucose-repressible alcohol dehydrogenase transcriptional effector [Wickerhamomyces ciferrii]